MKRSRCFDPDENITPKRRALESKSSNVDTDAHPFSFPFRPYETQLKLMSDLYDIFRSKSIGILESPTGTGKTLSSLCAVLTFLEDEQKRIQEEIRKNRNKASSLLDEAADLDFDGAMMKHHEAMGYTVLADTESQKLENIAKKISEARRRFDHYQTTQEIEIEDCVPRLSEEEEQPPELLKVVYATRTHSQIDQLTQELERTRFSHRVVSLGSRGILCPNSEVNKLPNSVAGDKCRDLRETNKCPFYNRSKVRLLTDYILSDSVRNHHEVLKESQCLKACGYYASREAAPFCEVIFVPYATLMDSEMRKSVGLTIDDKTIVIVDEAHNLFATLTDMSSSTVTLTELTRGLEILKKFLNCKSERTKAIDFKNLKLFENAIEKAKTLLEGPYFIKKEKKNFEIFEFMMELFDADGYRFIQAIEAAKKANLLSRIQSFCRSKEYLSGSPPKEERSEVSKSSLMSFLEKTKKKLNEEKQKSTSLKIDEPVNSMVSTTPESFPLFHLAEFAIALGSAGSNFQVIVDVASSPRKYHLLCLNGGERFESIVTKARSTVLIGGTMRPAELVVSLLTKDCGIPRQRIIDNTYGHIIDSTNLKIVTVAGDAAGPLAFTHATLKDKNIWTRILDSLSLLHSIPNGLVVFFPSKAFMNAFLGTIKQNKGPNFEALISRNLFVEGETDAWEKYSTKAKNQKATFFAVVGGKFSEGVNFSDELARCVVIVGLPYPNTMNPEFKAKVDYLKTHFEDESIGSKLPVNICMTQVNQAVGRVVRHKNDYGIVVLFDSRYSESRHADMISNWAKPSLVKCSTMRDAMTKLKGFRGIVQ